MRNDKMMYSYIFKKVTSHSTQQKSFYSRKNHLKQMPRSEQLVEIRDWNIECYMEYLYHNYLLPRLKKHWRKMGRNHTVSKNVDDYEEAVFSRPSKKDAHMNSEE